MTASVKTKERSSGIELLKIIAIFLIVISHTVQTLGSEFDFLPFNEYVLDYTIASTNIQMVILAVLRQCGALGNTLFFICSAWFLIDDDTVNKKKIMNMLLDIWIISVSIFVITFIFGGLRIGVKDTIKQFLPTTFSHNWYLTCYILFYAFHNHLNTIIKNLSQRSLLRVSVVLTFLYIVCDSVHGGHFEYSNLILWMTLYFDIAYMKFYLVELSRQKVLNYLLVAFGLLGFFGYVFVANGLGLKISFFENKLLHFGTNNSPFIILLSIGAFNIARNQTFVCKPINYISKLSLFIYVIHENILLRQYYRPRIWQYVFMNYGYNKVVLWVFIIALAIFIFGIVASIIYKNTLMRLSRKVSDTFYPLLKRIVKWFEDLLIRISK